MFDSDAHKEGSQTRYTYSNWKTPNYRPVTTGCDYHKEKEESIPLPAAPLRPRPPPLALAVWQQLEVAVRVAAALVVAGIVVVQLRRR
jgi:hypothetical protein